MLAALLIGACENDGGTYPSSPETTSSSSITPSDPALASSLAVVAPTMESDPLVTRIYATEREEEPVPLDAVDWP